MARIATPKFVVSDGGSGFRKAMKKVWKTARLQRLSLIHILPEFLPMPSQRYRKI